MPPGQAHQRVGHLGFLPDTEPSGVKIGTMKGVISDQPRDALSMPSRNGLIPWALQIRHALVNYAEYWLSVVAVAVNRSKKGVLSVRKQSSSRPFLNGVNGSSAESPPQGK